MSPLTILFLFTFCINFSLTTDPKPDQVIEFSRHGARAPFSTYDPQWSSSALMQLTTVGLLQHYKLGKHLAKKYPHLVESGYNPNDIYILSSPADRCIASAMSQMSSLFRGKMSTLKETPQQNLQSQILNRIAPHLSKDEAKRENFVPIQIEVAKSGTEQELIFANPTPTQCPKYHEYQNQNQASNEMKQAWNIFEDPIQKANKALPHRQKITDFSVLAQASDTFTANFYEKKTLPGKITDHQIINGINQALAYHLYLIEFSHEMQRQLLSFHTLWAILNHMKDFREGKNPKKLVLFSGSDNNLFIVLSAFGVINQECLLANYHQQSSQNKTIPYPNCQFPQYPKFASNLIFELYNDTADPYIKFYYNGNVIRLCGDQDHCTYDDFVAFVQRAYGNLTPETWKEVCFEGSTTIQTYSKTTEQENGNFIGKVEARGKHIWLVLEPILFILFGFSFYFIFKRLIKKKWNPFKFRQTHAKIKEEEEIEQSECSDVSVDVENVTLMTNLSFSSQRGYGIKIHSQSSLVFSK